MPGITWIGKFAEDFPFLDHHSTLKEKPPKVVIN
jgi:hypothetical protein